MADNRQRIIYIAGLGHSGSTILDLSLGVHPDVIGLGEVYTLFDKKRRENHYRSYCSCGVRARECVFWGEAEQVLEKSDSVDTQYRDLIEYFSGKFGEGKILVDSSKNSYSYLSFLKEYFDLRVIFLTRDVRSWIYSGMQSNGRSWLYLAFRWYLENRKLRFQLHQMGIDYLNVGYEELSLYPEHILNVVSKFVGISYREDMLNPGISGSHIISGNIARVDPMKKSRFSYDARWMLSLRLFLISPLLSVFSEYNRRYVYSNLTHPGKKGFYLFGSSRREEFSKKYN